MNNDEFFVYIKEQKSKRQRHAAETKMRLSAQKRIKTRASGAKMQIYYQKCK